MNVQGMPKLTIKKLRPAWYRSTLRSVSVFRSNLHGAGIEIVRSPKVL